MEKYLSDWQSMMNKNAPSDQLRQNLDKIFVLVGTL
jgi:hypothetical protein